MPKIDSKDIENIKQNIDFVSLVQRYVDLKQSGERWWGLCPFHQDVNPSFNVHPEKGFYYCFACNASGDLIDFYSGINGLEFLDAVQDLAQEAGVKLSFTSGSSSRNTSQRSECLQMQAIAQDYFSGLLKSDEGRKARDYLKNRGINQEVIKTFGLGWSLDYWQDLKKQLGKYGFSPEQGVQAGLLSQNKAGKTYDRFRGRITFPIYDLSGRVIAFGGRLIEDGDPKYLNSSESVVFKKGDHLYGLYQARKDVTQSKEVFLTEGYADVITMYQFGYTNSCGVLGTALTKKQVQRLSGLCRRVYLVFDGDWAGQQAAMRSAEMILSSGLEARVVKMPWEQDVDSLLKNKGSKEFDTLVKDSEDGLAFCFRMITYNNSPQDIMKWAVNFFKNLSDLSLRAYYLPRFAKGLNISEAELRESLDSKVKEQEKTQKEDLHVSGTAQRDRELLQFAIRYPEYLNILRNYDIKSALGTSKGKRLWDKLEQYNYKEISPYLDEGEKQFFVQSYIKEDEKDPEVIWRDIKDFLIKHRYRRRKKAVLESLKKAEQQGDQQEVTNLLQEYSNILKGG